MKTSYLLFGILVMAFTTYLIRVTPMVLFQRKINNQWVKSFLYYVPYVVLSAMTFPAIFSSTGSKLSSTFGCVVAMILAYFKRSLLTVALGAAITAFMVQLAGF